MCLPSPGPTPNLVPEGVKRAFSSTYLFTPGNMAPVGRTWTCLEWPWAIHDLPSDLSCFPPSAHCLRSGQTVYQYYDECEKNFVLACFLKCNTWKQIHRFINNTNIQFETYCKIKHYTDVCVIANTFLSTSLIILCLPKWSLLTTCHHLIQPGK